MRIRILSDLHREFGKTVLPKVDADLVVLAGDIDLGTKGVAWAKETFPDVPVLYVAGNHEHYDERIGRLHEKLAATAAGSNVRILENGTFALDRFRFFGATLWTDFNLFGNSPLAMLAAGSKATGMNDYRKIRRQDTGRLCPRDTAALHANSRLALRRFLAGGDLAHSVVVTHHAPSIQSIAAGREFDPLSPAFASRMEDLIVEHGPALWIHGHIHENRDYRIENTRILNNALGYPTIAGFEAVGFRADLVVEL